MKCYKYRILLTIFKEEKNIRSTQFLELNMQVLAARKLNTIIYSTFVYSFFNTRMEHLRI